MATKWNFSSNSDFEKNSQECSLGDPFQNWFAKFLFVNKMGATCTVQTLRNYEKVFFSETTGQILH